MSAPLFNRSLNLHDAIRKGRHDWVKHHLTDPEVDIEYIHGGRTPFERACYVGLPGMVQLFLDCERPINYNSQPNAGIMNCLYVTLGQPRIFRMLADDPRIDVNVIPFQGQKQNCLHVVHNFFRSLETVKVLLACERFNPEGAVARDWEGRTPSELMGDQRKYAELVNAFIKDPLGVRHQLREELGGYPEFQAGELFAIVVLLCDEYLEIKKI